MVTEQIDGFARLRGGLLANAACVPPLEREILPEQHAELVGCLVELRARDVGVDAQEVEPGVLCELNIAS